MGASTSVNLTQGFTSQISQASQENCTITCTTNFNNNTYIFNNYDGNVTIRQTCKFDDISCQLKSTTQASISQIIDDTISQTATVVNAVIPSLNSAKVKSDIEVHVLNSISQIISQNCAITESDTSNNNTFIFNNMHGNFNFINAGTQTSSSCALDTIAKASTFTQDKTQVKQTASIPSIFTYIIAAIAFVIIIVIVGGVFIAAKVVGAGSKVLTGGGGGGGGGVDMNQISNLINSVQKGGEAGGEAGELSQAANLLGKAPKGGNPLSGLIDLVEADPELLAFAA